MKCFHVAIIVSILALSACSSNRPVYSGHEESTQGVPGFVNGKKVSPNIKLGQSYTIDGETYVPRYQPDYVEEGDASWYGPGFHGGQTANGEEFDKYEMTAAHRTLPLPSIVRVTLLSTGKQAYVRINDRGPFAKGRIIDLSHAAADAIGLTRTGVGRVRVEYMPKESQRFADLLANGRNPKTIDMASEIIGQQPDVQLASNAATGWDNRLTPASVTTHESIPLSAPLTNEPIDKSPTPPTSDVMAVDTPPAASPFAVMNTGAGKPVSTSTNQPIGIAPVANAGTSTTGPPATADPPAFALSPAPAPSAPAAPVSESGEVIQLGAFLQRANAERMRQLYSSMGVVSVLTKPLTNGNTLFLVRMGPYPDDEQASEMLGRLRQMGVEARLVKS